jgi:small subunit ribosomal protein S6
MTLPAPTYDLVLLLDPEAEEATRAKLVADARAAIEAQGEFLRHDVWGNRPLAYPIDRKAVGEYHLLQFHADTPALLGALDRSLRIADDILRFRIVKLKPGVPDAPDMQGTPAPTRRPEPEPQAERPAEAGVETTAQAEPELEATPTGAGAEATPTGAGAEATPTGAGAEPTPTGAGVEAATAGAGVEDTPKAETDARAEPGVEVQAEVEADGETAHGEPS